MFPFECYVISLARTPNKLKAFIEENAATGLSFRHFEAVDGAALEWSECVSNGLIRQNARGYRRGTLGTASSHRALWRRAVTERVPVLVFEDDVCCRHDILMQLERVSRIISNWDILLLGYNTDAVLEVGVTPTCSYGGFFSQPRPSPQDLAEFAGAKHEVTALPLKNAFGMCSYLVSPDGAEKLLAKVFPLDNRELIVPYNRYLGRGDRAECRTLDMNVNTVYRHIAAYAVVPPLALPPNDKATSSTFGRTESAHATGHRRGHVVVSVGAQGAMHSITRRMLRNIQAGIGRIIRAE
jgi:glycosyl transferase, family 25